MGINSNINDFISDMESCFRAVCEEVDYQIIEMLCSIGEEAVSTAKTIPKERGFKDHSGNLRSSIGYAVFKDGKQVTDYFNQVEDGKEGVEKGKEFVEQIGKGTTGYTLVVVAGMNYAVYVESKGRDVLTSGEIKAKEIMPKHLDDTYKNVKSAMDEFMKKYGLK